MKLLLNIIVFLFAFGCMVALGDTSYSIIARGGVGASALRKWIPIDTASEIAKAEQVLYDTLISQGYFAAETERSSDTLFIDSGTKFSLAPARIFGDSAVVAPAQYSQFLIMYEAPFESWRVEASVEELLSWCENNGYPYAQVELDSMSLDFANNSVTPFLKLSAGPRITLEYIEFSGNEISQTKLLERESRLRIGSVFNEVRAKHARRRLSQLEYISAVSDPRIIVNDEGKSGLLFDVIESKLSRIDIVAGLTPKTEGEAQTVTGLIDLQFLNLFGTGRRGKVYWQRPSSGVQQLALAWREAWIGGTPLHADLSFEQRVEDTLYVTRKYGIRVGLPVSATTEIFTGISREELLADSATAATLGFVTNQTLLYEIGVTVDTRDHLTNPRGGIRFETTAARGHRATDDSPLGSDKTKFELQRATVDFEVNREVFPFWIANVSGHARILTSDEPRIQVADMYKLGGARTLRGFREEQFFGEQIAWTTIEARYWLGQSSRFAFFSDWGAVANNSESGGLDERAWDAHLAYGLGLRLETGIGIWGVDYGIATDNSPLNGQLHVSLLSLF
ncbi:MAG: BamA/TamA family outer membrane protein [bacterium]|nr:BamA/TamA family outer membrane protein [bacterium]